jgi:hypothetical protein
MKKTEKILSMVISGQTRAQALLDDFTELRTLIEGGVSTSPEPKGGLSHVELEKIETKFFTKFNRKIHRAS